MVATRIAVACLVVVVISAARLEAQDLLASARELYASAHYDEALKVLEPLSAGASSADERQSIDLYRTLCLLAVGRRDDADRAMEAIIARNPLFRPGEDLSPRTRTAFADARKRVLPAIVQRQYADARGAFDRKEFDAAAAGFKRVMDALNDPDLAAAAAEPPLSDLRTLAAGFQDLSMKAIPPPPLQPAPAPAVPVNLPPRIYTGEAAGLRPPIAIMQELPRYPAVVPPGGFEGVLEIQINEQGSVESAIMVESVMNVYDTMVLAAARKWQFHPAMLNGTPVKFRKRIQIDVRR